MPRFFVSYSRADRLFVDIFVPLLLPVYGNDSVWFDDQIPGGVDWWKLILDEIGKCDIFLFLMSNEALTSSYCQDEFREALRLDKAILPIVVRPKTDIFGSAPDDIKSVLQKINFIDLSKGPSDIQAVTKLYGSINRLAEQFTKSAKTVKVEISSDISEIIGAFFEAYQQREWARATTLIANIRRSDNVPDFFDVAEYEQLVIQQEKCEKQYHILKLMGNHSDPERYENALASYAQSCGDYDPDGLLTHISTQNVPTIMEFMPEPFEWCEVPEGAVNLVDRTIQSPLNETVHVKAFRIAKYPITNRQFELFVTDDEGYSNEEWWNYSSFAIQWHKSNPQPKPTAFSGDNMPRTNVSWFEAVAFCRWLSQRLEEEFRLPLEQEWQRAAQGDDNREFPWGDTFEAKYCNYATRSTTSVTSYPEGISPFGVMNMCGNVLEWCLNDYSRSSYADLKSNQRRILRGGSWHKTAQDELKTTFRVQNYPDFRVDNRGFRIVSDI